MTNLIRAEFLKIRTTRTVYGLFAAMLALVAFGVLASSHQQEGAEQFGSLGEAVPVVDQEFLFLAGSIAWLFVLILALRSFTDEFRHDSIVPTLLGNPDRRRVLLAKILAVSATGMGFILGAYALALAIGVPRLGQEGASTNVATPAMAALLCKALLLSILWAALGVGLGLAVRHSVAAIAGSFVWIMFIETFVESEAPRLARYLPVHGWIAVMEPSNVKATDGPLLGAVPAGFVLAAWAVAVILVGAALFRRREIA